MSAVPKGPSPAEQTRSYANLMRRLSDEAARLGGLLDCIADNSPWPGDLQTDLRRLAYGLSLEGQRLFTLGCCETLPVPDGTLWTTENDLLTRLDLIVNSADQLRKTLGALAKLTRAQGRPADGLFDTFAELQWISGRLGYLATATAERLGAAAAPLASASGTPQPPTPPAPGENTSNGSLFSGPKKGTD